MSHLALEQRYTISAMLTAGYKQKEIAERIGRDKSVVSRETRRNAGNRNQAYKPELA